MFTTVPFALARVHGAIAQAVRATLPLLAVGICAAMTPLSGQAAVVTMLSITQTDAQGRPNGPIIYRTARLPAQVVPLYVAAGTAPALEAPFINADPATQASLRLDLPVGLHTFTLYANQGTRMLDFSSLMIHFNDRIDGPQIAAFAPFWTNQVSQPGFAANALLGPGLAYDDGRRRVELTDYFFASGSRYPGVDRVTDFGIGRDGNRDAIGQFSLRISNSTAAVPEPATALLVMSAALLGTVVHRRQRRGTNPATATA